MQTAPAATLNVKVVHTRIACISLSAITGCVTLDLRIIRTKVPEDQEKINCSGRSRQSPAEARSPRRIRTTRATVLTSSIAVPRSRGHGTTLLKILKSSLCRARTRQHAPCRGRRIERAIQCPWPCPFVVLTGRYRVRRGCCAHLLGQGACRDSRRCCSVSPVLERVAMSAGAWRFLEFALFQQNSVEHRARRRALVALSTITAPSAAPVRLPCSNLLPRITTLRAPTPSDRRPGYRSGATNDLVADRDGVVLT